MVAPSARVPADRNTWESTVAHALKDKLDSALKAAKDPAATEKVRAGVKEGACWAGGRARTAAKAVRDPAARATLRREAKDGLAWVANRVHPALLRASKGKVGAKLGKAPVLLLTTTGRRSGKERTVPLLYLAEGERLVVVASYGGDDRSPAWFLNLTDTPAATVELDGVRRPVTASVADAAEKERLWPRLLEIYRYYDNYQRKTDRDIPVVWLDPA
jgi:deazaflavin-dependent oxidoreductase (nitroreductase family)